MEILIAAVTALAGVCIYLLPAIVANKRRHKNSNSIFVLNLFLGWSGVGWIVALVWALTNQEAAQA